MDPSYIRVPPGAGSKGFYSHNGEEFAYVISGVLFVELKDLRLPHRWSKYCSCWLTRQGRGAPA
jgi:hypothetical protein